MVKNIAFSADPCVVGGGVASRVGFLKPGPVVGVVDGDWVLPYAIAATAQGRLLIYLNNDVLPAIG